MTKKKGGKQEGAGRPPREFDVSTKKIFENLCRVQCTVNEIESILNVNQRTLNKMCLKEYLEDFSTVFKRFSEGGKGSLRRIQFKLAEKSASMAIFLGKNILGQTDQIVQKIESKQEIITKSILELPDNGHRHASN